MTILFYTQKIVSLSKSEDMNLFEFNERFPNEQVCIEYMKNMRIKLGITCKNCSGTNHYWKSDKEMFQCKRCSYRLSLKNGTALEDSNLPLLTWFKAIHLLSATKKTFSALEIQKQLKHKKYQPIWEMLHKIRCAMGVRDSKYDLCEYLEIDEGFFTVFEKDEILDSISTKKKRGRGSESQAKVLVLIESIPVVEQEEKYKNKPNRKCGHIKMIVMNDLKALSINQEIEQNVREGTEAITDKYQGYSKLKELINHHQINTSELKEVHKVLPWVHSAIGNAKKVLQGLHHSIGAEYLQSYLNEFCYKYNRRYIDNLFDRVLIACIQMYG